MHTTYTRVHTCMHTHLIMNTHNHMHVYPTICIPSHIPHKPQAHFPIIPTSSSPHAYPHHTPTFPPSHTHTHLVVHPLPAVGDHTQESHGLGKVLHCLSLPCTCWPSWGSPQVHGECLGECEVDSICQWGDHQPAIQSHVLVPKPNFPVHCCTMSWSGSCSQ